MWLSQLVLKLARLEGLGKSDRVEELISFLTAGGSVETLLMCGHSSWFMVYGFNVPVIFVHLALHRGIKYLLTCMFAYTVYSCISSFRVC